MATLDGYIAHCRKILDWLAREYRWEAGRAPGCEQARLLGMAAMAEYVGVSLDAWKRVYEWEASNEDLSRESGA